ncbi:MAG: SufD family Fe-S cluster assembly protein, partial [Euryarchaeota archaeon]|nr:SufD family Fe-S cluster assembly protein [Euryarchaeota archaeon]
MSSIEAEMRRRAEAALEKKAALGEDIDLSKYQEGARDIPEISSLDALSDEAREAMLRSGVIPTGEGRDGSIVVLDNSMVSHSAASKAYEVMDIRAAMK